MCIYRSCERASLRTIFYLDKQKVQKCPYDTSMSCYYSKYIEYYQPDSPRGRPQRSRGLIKTSSINPLGGATLWPPSKLGRLHIPTGVCAAPSSQFRKSELNVTRNNNLVLIWQCYGVSSFSDIYARLQKSRPGATGVRKHGHKGVSLGILRRERSVSVFFFFNCSLDTLVIYSLAILFSHVSRYISHFDSTEVVRTTLKLTTAD